MPGVLLDDRPEERPVAVPALEEADGLGGVGDGRQGRDIEGKGGGMKTKGMRKEGRINRGGVEQVEVGVPAHPLQRYLDAISVQAQTGIRDRRPRPLVGLRPGEESVLGTGIGGEFRRAAYLPGLRPG